MFVLDNSVAVAWFIEDEADAAVDAILDRMEAGEDAVVPGLWPAELLNALGNAVRHGRMDTDSLQASLDAISDLPIMLDSQPATVGALYGLQRSHDVSPYDLCYLELAVRLGVPLATKDLRLAKAADAAGVTLLLQAK